MDSKITLAFNKEVIENAKAFAASHNISLSRLTEFLLRQITTGDFKTLDELPVSDWVHTVAEGQVEYHSKPRNLKYTKQQFYDSRK